MLVVLDKVGKRYNREWIFRNLSLSFETNQAYAITGPNGSGKSTLLQVISGAILQSEGTINYSKDGSAILPEDLYKHLSFASPYLELIEEFTLSELVDFHLKFKKFRGNISKAEFMETLKFEKAKNKEVKYFSSGMKQRLKLGLALFSDSALLLLDEPTSNLDHANIEWYREEVVKHIHNRITIVCSNQPYEYEFCPNTIDLVK